MVAPRIVSLVPSMTETLLAWGITPIACTRFCEQPHIAHVGGTKDPDVDAVVGLAPDLVIVDAEENRIEDHDALVAAGLDVHALSIRSVDDVDAQLGPLADRLGVRWTPVGTAGDDDGDPDRAPDRAPPPAAPSVRAFVPIWRRPWMALGAPTYGTSLLASVGIDNVFADDGAYPQTTLADAAARRPDVVLAPSEPYPFAERHRPDLETVAPTVLVDGRDLFWWGSRTAAARSRLRSLVSRP